MSNDASYSPDSVVERVVSVIRFLAQDHSLHGVNKVSRELNISKSTTYRILASMETLGWAVQDGETRKYRLGPDAIQAGFSMVADLINLDQVSLPHLYELRDATTESAALAVRVGLDMVYTQQVFSEHELRPVIRLGKRYGVWVGATGKAILAYLDRQELDSVVKLSEDLRAHPSGIELVDKPFPSEAELAEIRRQGFALSFGERVGGLGAVASPIFGFDQRVVGSVAVAVPLFRFDPETIERYAPIVLVAAKRISANLGA